MGRLGVREVWETFHFFPHTTFPRSDEEVARIVKTGEKLVWKNVMRESFSFFTPRSDAF